MTVVTGTCVSRALSVSCLCRLPRSGASLCLLSRDSSVSDERARRREGAVCGLRTYVTTTMWPCVLKRMRPLCHPVILPPSQPLRSPHHSHIRHRQHSTSAPRHSHVVCAGPVTSSTCHLTQALTHADSSSNAAPASPPLQSHGTSFAAAATGLINVCAQAALTA